MMTQTFDVSNDRRPLPPRFCWALMLVLASIPDGAVRAEVRSNPPADQGALELTIEYLDRLTVLPGKLGARGSVPIPADNPQVASKIALGRSLFFDKRLSADSSLSCATCHVPSKGYADGKPLATGLGGHELQRHTPTALDAAYYESYFWDGRAASLEQQALGPLLSAGEMNMGTEPALVERLRSIPEYKDRFREAFGEEPNPAAVGKAIAAFERTLITGQSRFDRYAAGDKQALTEEEKRGLLLFVSKASCVACHQGPNFTDNKFHNLGVPQADLSADDTGRFGVTHAEPDRGAFRTPSLRNLALTSPYMHNGSLRTLEDVIEFYNQGGGHSPKKSKLMFKLDLSPQQKQDLVAFLRTLTGDLPTIAIRLDGPTTNRNQNRFPKSDGATLAQTRRIPCRRFIRRPLINIGSPTTTDDICHQ